MSGTELTALIVALSGLCTILASFLGTVWVNKRAAKKDDLTELRTEIERLWKRIKTIEDEKDSLRKKYEKVVEENYRLASQIIDLQNQIHVLQHERVQLLNEE